MVMLGNPMMEVNPDDHLEIRQIKSIGIRLGRYFNNGIPRKHEKRKRNKLHPHSPEMECGFCFAWKLRICIIRNVGRKNC